MKQARFAQDVAGPLAVLAAVPVAAVLVAASVASVLAAASVAAVLVADSVALVLAAGSVVAVLVADSVAAMLVAVLVVGSVVAVLVAGSVAAMLVAGSVTAVLVASSGTAVLLAVHVAVQVVVQVAVFSAVPVGVNVDRWCDTGPIVGATMPSPDLPLIFWPFPTLDGGAAVLPLSPFVFPEPLVAGVFTFSLWDVGNFLTFAGGGMSLPSLRGTQAALMLSALQKPAVAGATVPGDVVAEVLGWDLESLDLGDGRGVCREEVNVSQEFLFYTHWDG
ncbi:hypothetical protein NDU88_003550 [Pleurodeles waltl]|uniref:Uncharacterized protein n=1 Tax=Pleurodeles waltl TaxID=8319 RepID=A0AAV7W7U8_PLEWA|nr:hypothetical protein NDU88_003550 [Pleurodeles waltl]